MANKDTELITGAPLIGLIHSNDQTRSTQLRAGRFTKRIWLRATEQNLAVQPISAALEVSALKQMLADYFHVKHPQHLFRVGWSTPLETPTPRRPVQEVLR